MRSWRRKSKRANDESLANGKTVIDFYQTNYGNGEIQPITSEWLTPELGPEAIARLTVEDFPAIVAIDSEGNNFYEVGQAPYKKI